MPVLPEVGSISTVSGLMMPSCSIAAIIAAPMRSFTLRGRVEIFQLGQDRRLDAVLLRQPVQPHQRRVADRRRRSTVIDPAATGLCAGAVAADLIDAVAALDMNASGVRVSGCCLAARI